MAIRTYDTIILIQMLLDLQNIFGYVVFVSCYSLLRHEKDCLDGNATAICSCTST